MRVIAGTYRSRLLKSLKGSALRPTSDRLRETLFNVLGAGVSGSRFLDVFAGTGAVGIEALSRGAAYVAFIENHAPASALIRKNLESLQICSEATVILAEAVRGLETLSAKIENGAAARFDYIFIDPPYAAAEDYARTFKSLESSEILAVSSIVIVEHRKTFALPESYGSLERVRLLRQGDAALSFYRHRPAEQKETADAGNP
jgi:16S rRNA (guanine(966)-N(2))-methyltransferase RsmD